MNFLPNLLANRPYVAEHDFAGVVVDANGTRFTSGDQLFGWIPASMYCIHPAIPAALNISTDLRRKTRQGTLAQYLKVPAEYLLHRPSTVTPIEAAGITLAAMTSYRALYTIAQLGPEQTVLINGGSTAVGEFAIQLAKARGVKVVAIASGKNKSFARRMGADEVSIHDHVIIG